MLVLLVAALCSLPTSAGSRTISTWIAPGDGGIGNRDLTEALAWVTKNQGHISSLSAFRYGTGGAQNLTAASFNTQVRALGIDVYTLWGGNYGDFENATAIAATVAEVLDMVTAGNFSGVDLDFEHPESWGPQFVGMNSTTRAELRAQYSRLLRALSSALHAAGSKMSECVGTYPTRQNGVDVYYDPQVIGETNDVVRVMNYDMFYVGGRGVLSLRSRPDCAGMGPTSTQQWAKFSMEWWLQYIPKSKLVMGLPSYSNDYSALPGFGGCLLYTSDAADEEDSVDLGGRRIIKKKKTKDRECTRKNIKRRNIVIHKL
eukprot:TRINITY_DN54476_c0_g1_i1.p1 TRINITY_DN54476_c0_g1~~TRINITY_DN54476_c0_g1_i1.p1  ORF type:complete len:316 (+),score=63.59 TRINITY_DN54476_c0_g1_i1:234-1181(+)